MSRKEKITKRFVDSLNVDPGKRILIFDTELAGFCLRASSQNKIYYAVKWMVKKAVWVKIGLHGVLTPDQARTLAREKLYDMEKGINPNITKIEKRNKELVTVEHALDKYFLDKKNLRTNTEQTYRRLINNHLKDWLQKELKSITPEMIVTRFNELKTTASNSSAINSMRTFRIIYNYAKSDLETSLPENVMKKLSGILKRHNIDRRKTFIKKHQLPGWWKTVSDLDNDYIKYYLQLLLLTGIRENEGLTLEWSNVDLKDKSFTILSEIAKNGKEITLPMSDYVHNIFKQLYSKRLNDYVFPSLVNTEKHLVEVARQVKSVRTTSNVEFCLHDLRRTYTTISQNIVPYIVLKKLLNHATDKDVTAGYISLDTDSLRPHQQKITNAILDAVGISKGHSDRKVIPIRKFS
jgi:integrase